MMNLSGMSQLSFLVPALLAMSACQESEADADSVNETISQLCPSQRQEGTTLVRIEIVDEQGRSPAEYSPVYAVSAADVQARFQELGKDAFCAEMTKRMADTAKREIENAISRGESTDKG
ncbi:hypothetical protein ACSBOB_15485 [Mesorhizobium sp. ASY16-5R]|uniref:hypothetical protein n=1 Tax=Mesorhizobium sp. ASY16-5R TaxID=3445772 RepID=UPI003FA00A9E